MSKAKPKHDPKALPLTATPTETPEQAKARAALMPSVNAATVIDAYQANIMGKDVDLQVMVESLRDTMREINSGDLTKLENMLVAQATALQTMFTSLARRASFQEQLKHYEVFMGLALKAQAQSRATISALVDLKYPRQATFIKQANVAHGPQQVNNAGTPPTNSEQYAQARAHAKETKTDQPELLEVDHGGKTLDRGAEATAARSHPTMETMGAVNRPQNTRRKDQGSTQR